METSVFLTLLHFKKRVVTNTDVPNFHAILSTAKKTIAIPQNYIKPPGLQTPTLQSAHATVKDCIHPRSYENCWIHRFVSQTFRSFSLSSSSAAVCSSTSWSRWRTARSSLELQSMLTLDSHFRWTMKSQTAGNGGQGWNKVLYGHIRTTGNQEPCGDQSHFSIKHTVHYKVLYSTCAQFHI